MEGEQAGRDGRRQPVEWLRYCRDMPTLPGIALELLRMAEDDSRDLKEFGRVISRDPALAAKLLRVANSAFYGRRSHVSALSQAVTLLGLNATVAFALSFSVRGTRFESAEQCFDIGAYWRRSLLTALAAHSLAVEIGDKAPEDLWLSGLLRGIGILAMATAFTDRYTPIWDWKHKDLELRPRERDEFGFDHVEAGTWLLERWHLPEQLWRVVEFSYMESRDVPAFPARTRQRALTLAGAAVVAGAWDGGATPETLSRACADVDVALGIDADRCRRVIIAMHAAVPELESLFETRMVDVGLLQGIEASKQEILMSRGLSRSHQMAAEKRVTELELRTRELEETTHHDPLTGAFNRNYLQQVLAREMERTNRTGSPLTVAFLDIDHFKKVNDRLGHGAGDEVLVEVARRLVSALRRTDTLARYGGEEFVAVLVDATAAGAEASIRRALSAVRESPCHSRREGSGWTVNVTLSAGLATYGGLSTTPCSAAELLHRADTLLYEAKRTGRDRVVVDAANDADSTRT